MGSPSVSQSTRSVGDVWSAGRGSSAGTSASGVSRAPTSVGGSAAPRARGMRGWLDARQAGSALGILMGILVVTCLALRYPGQVPWAMLLPLVVLSGTMHVPWVHSAILASAFVGVWLSAPAFHDSTAEVVGATATTAAIGAVTLWRSVARARVGVQGTRGEAMLSDLRQRHIQQSLIPRLPGPWRGELCVEPAFGHRFSGDFAVSRRTRRGLLEVLLVDIAGKGMDAGTRSLVLSGGLDALVGTVPPPDLLGVANDYLLRQKWDEGFATAAYVTLDLRSGDFTTCSAGHPPVLWYRAERDEWLIVAGRCGPVLGVDEHARYEPYEGRLERGDALLLYTDGLIEDRRIDLDVGLCHMIDGLAALHGRGFEGLATRMCDNAPSGDHDDRGVVLLWSQ